MQIDYEPAISVFKFIFFSLLYKVFIASIFFEIVKPWVFVSSSLVKLIWVDLYYIVICKERILYVLIFKCKKQGAKNSIERSVSVYLLFLFVFVHICIHFENVQIVDESVNLWGVCWKN